MLFLWQACKSIGERKRSFWHESLWTSLSVEVEKLSFTHITLWLRKTMIFIISNKCIYTLKGESLVLAPPDDMYRHWVLKVTGRGQGQKVCTVIVDTCSPCSWEGGHVYLSSQPNVVSFCYKSIQTTYNIHNTKTISFS